MHHKCTYVCSYYMYFTLMLHILADISSDVCIWNLLFMALSLVMMFPTISFSSRHCSKFFNNNKHVVLCAYVCMEILITILVYIIDTFYISYLLFMHNMLWVAPLWSTEKLINQLLHNLTTHTPVCLVCELKIWLSLQKSAMWAQQITYFFIFLLV